LARQLQVNIAVVRMYAERHSRTHTASVDVRQGYSSVRDRLLSRKSCA